MIFKPQDYASRNDLERAIRAEVGDDLVANRKDGHIIEGKKEDLKRKHLSGSASIFGCRVVVTDQPFDKELKSKPKEVPDRGPMKRPKQTIKRKT